MSHNSYEEQNGCKQRWFWKYFRLGISTNIGVKVWNYGTYISSWVSNFQTYQRLLTSSCFGRSKQNSGFRWAKVLGWGYIEEGELSFQILHKVPNSLYFYAILISRSGLTLYHCMHALSPTVWLCSSHLGIWWCYHTGSFPACDVFCPTWSQGHFNAAFCIFSRPQIQCLAKQLFPG